MSFNLNREGPAGFPIDVPSDWNQKKSDWLTRGEWPGGRTSLLPGRATMQGLIVTAPRASLQLRLRLDRW